MTNGFIFKKYNNSNSLIVVASYPKKGEVYSRNISADASFTKNLLISFKKLFPRHKIIVFTAVVDKEEIYEENGILVIRTFVRNNPISYITLINKIKKFNKVKKVLLQFEFSSFGNNFSTGIFTLFLLFLRLIGKDITFNLHQVISDLSDLSGHIGIAKNGFKLGLLNLILDLYYKTVGYLSHNIIVTEEYLKSRLKKTVAKNNIYVINHGVNLRFRNVLSKEKARNILDINKKDIVLMCFGYISWYKGTDFIINALKGAREIENKKIKLIIAGGLSFTQNSNSYYQKFLNKTLLMAQNSENIAITGFIEEEDISLYFSSADFLIFPYRTFMSSSGTISLAVSFGKPFIISKKLRPILYSRDIKISLKKVRLKSQDLVFDMREKAVVQKIKDCLNPKTLLKMKVFSKLLSNERNFDKIAPLYHKIIFS